MTLACVLRNVWAMHTDELLTSADACRELSIDRSTLSRWVASGRLTPAVKLPGIRGPFLFTPAAIKAAAKDDAA